MRRRGLRAVDSSRGRLRRVLPVVVGVALLLAALWVVADHRASVLEGVRHAAGSPWWAVALVIVFPVVSIGTTSASLWLLTRRYGPVGYAEMHALVAGAMLLNFLPMRPGLLGRLAYHKRVNGILVRHSVRVLIEAGVLSLVSAGVLLGIGASGALGHSVGADAFVLGMPYLLLLAVWWFARREPLGGVLAAGAVRYLDMLVWTARYGLLLWMLGTPVGLEEAVVIASLSQVAMLAPTGGGGVGVREWTVGLVGGGLGATLETALVADLVNRSAELAAAVPLGLVGLWLVRRRVKGGPRARKGGGEGTTGGSGEGSGPDASP
ncbi:MAG: hypothetical protein ACF8Q5_07150 [Phycisphaerales bacterium JB040]